MDGGLHLSRGEVSGTKSKIKRTCCNSSLQDSSNRIQNANPLDALLESFLDFSDSSAIAFDLSFERIIECRICDFEKDDVIQRAIRLGSTLTEVARRSAMKRASKHNADVWALPADLTVKVFSMLDTQSVCYAAAACSFFQKCAADPLCYSNIDLIATEPKVNNLIVSTMVERAGKSLRSLKLGVRHCLPLSLSSGFSWNDKRSRQGKELSRSCLAPLIGVNGHAPGARLRRLHLYNIERMDNVALHAALSACPSLLDLEIVGILVELSHTLQSVSTSCHLIERLHFVSTKTGRDDSLKLPACVDLVKNCPNMSSLGLRGFKLHDCKARVLVKVWDFCRLKHVDLSGCYSFNGEFLKNLGGSSGGSLLEVINLRDCMHLREGEVSRLLAAILSGRFKHLMLLDISNREGLATDTGWYRRSYTPCLDSLAELQNSRPNLVVVAEYPAEERSMDECMVFSDTSNSDVSSESSSSSTSSFHSNYSGSDLVDDYDLNAIPGVENPFHHWV